MFLDFAGGLRADIAKSPEFFSTIGIVSDVLLSLNDISEMQTMDILSVLPIFYIHLLLRSLTHACVCEK